MLTLLRRLLLAGGTVAVLGLGIVATGALAGEPREPAGGAVSTAGSSSPGGAAAAAGALLAADPTGDAAAADQLSGGRLRRPAAWRRLVHATATLDLPALGGLTTIQLDHGTVGAASATALTVKEAGGAQVTVRIGSETKVRVDGAKAVPSDLAVGDEVFVMSRVEADGVEAYLVVVPKS